MTNEHTLPEMLHAEPDFSGGVCLDDGARILEIDTHAAFRLGYRKDFRTRLLNRYNACAGLGGIVLPEGWVKRVVDMMLGPGPRWNTTEEAVCLLRDELEAVQPRPETTVVSEVKSPDNRITTVVYADGHIDVLVDGTIVSRSPAGTFKPTESCS